MITIKLEEEYVEEVFEIMCLIPFEPPSTTDNEPSTMRHPGIEAILTQLQRFVYSDLDDELESLAGEYECDMEDYEYFKKHICSECIKTGDNIQDGIECEMSDADIDNCFWAMNAGDD